MGETPPTNWLVRNGGTFDEKKWPELAALLGGNTLPDDRGLFVRGYDPTGLNDSEGTYRGFASYQEGSFLAKNGTNNWPMGFVAVGSGDSPPLYNKDLHWDNVPSGTTDYQLGWPNGSGHGGVSASDNMGVSRPRNRNYLPIVYAGTPAT